jgi:hypothetical protein
MAQEKVNIRTIRSQTADAVAFKISVPQSSYAPSQDIVINYDVTNNSKKVARSRRLGEEIIVAGPERP